MITGKKQIISVKVQSTQDVNDPEIKSATLEMVGLVLHTFNVQLVSVYLTQNLSLLEAVTQQTLYYNHNMTEF